jgi:hypothetical protein
MLVTTGVYRFARRELAFRNDFCLSCEAPTVALCVQTFDCFHVFWIPLLPLGFRCRWMCMHCGSDAHARVRTSRRVKALAVFLLCAVALAAWLAPSAPGEQVAIWVMRILLPLAALALTVNTVRSKPVPKSADRLKVTPPSDATVCPRCGVELRAEPEWHCPACGIRRL